MASDYLRRFLVDYRLQRSPFQSLHSAHAQFPLLQNSATPNAWRRCQRKGDEDVHDVLAVGRSYLLRYHLDIRLVKEEAWMG